MTQSPPNMAHSPFQFATEFTPDGDVIGGPKRKYVLREEADQIALNARAEGEAKAKATGIASMDRIVGHLEPVSTQLVQLAEVLRREAAELALVAARKIAGDALDKVGTEAAANAIAEAIKLLKDNPVVTVSLPPHSIPEVEQRMEQLRRQGRTMNIAFVADPNAKPGDWRVEWGEGSLKTSREIDEVVSA